MVVYYRQEPSNLYKLLKSYSDKGSAKRMPLQETYGMIEITGNFFIRAHSRTMTLD